MMANFGAVLNDLIRLGPGIRQDDGKLDLCVFSPGTARDAARVAWKLLRKDFRADPCMLYRAGRHFRIETDPPRPVQADGELLGATPFEVTVEPLAAQLLVPRTSGREATKGDGRRRRVASAPMRRPTSTRTAPDGFSSHRR